MSVMVIVTEVVAVLPESIPLMSWALTTTTYWLLVSRSRVSVVHVITPAERQRRCYLLRSALIHVQVKIACKSIHSFPKWICYQEMERLLRGRKCGAIAAGLPETLSMMKEEVSPSMDKEYLSAPFAVEGSSASVASTFTTWSPGEGRLSNAMKSHCVLYYLIQIRRYFSTDHRGLVD